MHTPHVIIMANLSNANISRGLLCAVGVWFSVMNILGRAWTLMMLLSRDGRQIINIYVRKQENIRQ